MWKTIFLVLIGTLSFSHGQKEEESTSKNPRAINLFVINDIGNNEANQSIAKTLQGIKNHNPNWLGDIISMEINGSDPQQALPKICAAWDTAVNSMQGPDLVLDTTRSGFGGETVRTFTAAVGVPTLSAQFVDRENLTHWSELPKNQQKYLVHIKPPAHLLPNAIRHLIVKMKIPNAAVIFDDNFVMDTKFNTLLNGTIKRYVIIRAKKSRNDTLEQLNELKRLNIMNFFILGEKNTIFKYLQTGTSYNFNVPYYNWYTFTLDHDSIAYGNDNVPPIVLFKPNITSNTLQRMKELDSILSTPGIMSAFYYDFIRAGIEAMRSAVKEKLWPAQPHHITCDEFNHTNTPVRNFDLLLRLKKVSSRPEFKTTFAKFKWGAKNGDHQAQFYMDIFYTPINSDIRTSDYLGSWIAGVDSSVTIQKESQQILNNYTSAHYRVVAVISPPFVQFNNITKQWSGFCIDMLKIIAMRLNFSYEIYLSPEYGMLTSEVNENSWNGMVAELINKNADIALGAFSITAERDRVIDFTINFYKHVGISILMQKQKPVTFLFKFLTVLETDVWLCILASYFFTSILMWIFDRYSPYSYQNNKEKYKDDEEKRVFNLKECLWFCMTSLTPQGGGEAPKNLSGRLVAATWWLFGFIIIASYTANLAAFLTVSRLETPIESLDDLSKQYKVQYAPIMNSEAYTYFQRMSNIEAQFYEIWKDMSLNDSLSEVERAKLAVWDYPVSDKYTKMFEAMNEARFPLTRDEAISRVRREQTDENKSPQPEYAWVGDASEIRYLTMTSCDVIMVGEEFSKKPYGIGVQEGSPLRDKINNVIVQMRREKMFDYWEKKWWDKNPNRKVCEKIHDQNEGVNMENIGGVFIVIFVGIILACVILSLEYWFFSYRRRKQCKKQTISKLPKTKVAWQETSPSRFNINKPSKLSIDAHSNTRSRF